MRGFGITDIGKKRSKNEDNIFVSDIAIGGLANLYIIADGMGGHKAGETASLQAIKNFCQFIRDNSDFIYIENHLEAALRYANLQVFDMACKDPELRGMGTTLTAIVFDSKNLYFAHVGDSRIYIVQNEQKPSLKQLTYDHSLVEELVRKGEITPEEARIHPDKNVVTRAVGTDSRVLIDKGFHNIEGVEKILITSDGLTNMLQDPQILEIILEKKSTEQKLKLLVDAANRNGGMDNISAILIEK